MATYTQIMPPAERELRSTVFFLNGDRYVGEWSANRMNGKGSYRWKASLATYDGDWVDGRRCGHGVLSVVTGRSYRRQYVGQWCRDKRHGFGINVDDRGEKYEGEWRADRRHGIGRIRYNDGSRYVGQWVNDVCHGHGTLTMANGDVYEGQWRDDVRHGLGSYKFLSKNKTLSGEWLDGTLKHGMVTSFN